MSYFSEKENLRVSLCTIAYNEESVLNGLFRDFSEQSYPHDKIEIILVDNASTDNTKAMMKEFARTDYGFESVKLVDSTNKNQATAWNEALMHATGDIIIRVDAHSKIPRYFVAKNVFEINEGEDIVGGGRPNTTDGMTPWKLTLLAAEESLFGSSVADYRRAPGQKIYLDSLFHAAYKREVFEKVGGFNEDLGRTEDNELHYRMRMAGYKFCCCPEIISFQHTRNTLRAMIKQKYGNGYWIGLTSGVCFKCLNYFHFIPFVFVMALLFSLLLWLLGNPTLFAVIIAMYSMFNLVNTVGCLMLKKPNLLFLTLPFIFPVLHISYGVGTLVGLIKMPFWKKKLDDTAEKRIEMVKQAIKKNTKKKDDFFFED
ncbi:MAG: glycosyltransferase family 2 protein [Ruminococcus sp.]|nr:glycosyltransferase family 2 protein [Ruminococcus sp.]